MTGRTFALTFVLLAGLPLAAAGDDLPPAIRAVAIDQRLGQRVPLDAAFTDSTGAEVTLANYFTDRPVILVLAYYRCPRLCSQVLNKVAETLREMSLVLGKDYTVLTVSFDPEEKPELAAAKRQAYLDAYGVRRDGWYFLTGREAEIRRLTEAVGFRYVWNEEKGQYEHSTAIIVLTPQGDVSKYFFGIDYSPRHVQLGLTEASSNAIGTPVDKVLLLTCLSYDPATGTYSLALFKLMRAAALLTLAAVGGYVAWNLRRERRSAPAVSPAASEVAGH